mmetsp:Transcript_87585/g.249100  ORF Transcript_87585/g.249100 Transcript_87585/m.249100 type:complete len:253 (-) Transcript_87585:545-1303(-)
MVRGLATVPDAGGRLRRPLVQARAPLSAPPLLAPPLLALRQPSYRHRPPPSSPPPPQPRLSPPLLSQPRRPRQPQLPSRSRPHRLAQLRTPSPSATRRQSAPPPCSTNRCAPHRARATPRGPTLPAASHLRGPRSGCATCSVACPARSSSRTATHCLNAPLPSSSNHCACCPRSLATPPDPTLRAGRPPRGRSCLSGRCPACDRPTPSSRTATRRPSGRMPSSSSRCASRRCCSTRPAPSPRPARRPRGRSF